MPQLPRTGVSIREFARLDGCSHTAVQNALKSGRLKVSEDGTLDPALAGTTWRAGNYKIVRGGKPRAAKRQVASERQPAPAALPPRAWAPPTPDQIERVDRGILCGLSHLGANVPALAAEIAQRHGVSDARAFFEELRQATSDLITAEIAESDIDPEFAIDFYGDPDKPAAEFLPLEDYRLPGETEDERWARIIPAEAA